jgi:hypothetical protein
MRSDFERFEVVEYRLPDGHVFKYTIDHHVGITTEHIDKLCSKYYEHSGLIPEIIFVRTDMWAAYLCNMNGLTRFNVPVGSKYGLNVVQMYTTIGCIYVKHIVDAYIPLLIGTQKDYDDNNLNWLFEEIVLDGCEHEE